VIGGSEGGEAIAGAIGDNKACCAAGTSCGTAVGEDVEYDAVCAGNDAACAGRW